MKMTVERPGEEEIHLLFKRYGRPIVREFRVDLRERDEKQDYPPCKGGSRIAIKKGGGIVMVSSPGGESWGLPGGRIVMEESVEDGAIREAKEETGLEIELKGLAQVHKNQYLFREWNLERWIFVFTAVAVGGCLTPEDEEEVGGIAVFPEPPPNLKEVRWLRTVWNECLGL